MAQFKLGCNVSVLCPTCQTNPVATINGRQVSECAPCYARSIRLLGEYFSDLSLYIASGNLEAAIERSTTITIEEELARR
jgi:hypothetical protein